MLVPLVFFGLAWLGPAAEATDRCVECHTDATRLRALAQEPAAGEEEGEG